MAGIKRLYPSLLFLTAKREYRSNRLQKSIAQVLVALARFSAARPWEPDARRFSVWCKQWLQIPSSAIFSNHGGIFSLQRHHFLIKIQQDVCIPGRVVPLKNMQLTAATLMWERTI